MKRKILPLVMAFALAITVITPLSIEDANAASGGFKEAKCSFSYDCGYYFEGYLKPVKKATHYKMRVQVSNKKKSGWKSYQTIESQKASYYYNTIGPKGRYMFHIHSGLKWGKYARLSVKYKKNGKWSKWINSPTMTINTKYRR